MKKKKQRQVQRQSQMNQPKKESLTLGDQLNDSLMQQLKNKKKELQVREEKKEVAELERKRQEQKEREKNKSFEELLSESNLTWKDFK
ncbi:YqkE family protein [Bacillus toyonensis]|nr:YqkE family protein [Bacillus toyonensis]HDX9609451.1 YqkE family protein [Bacillus toyonensis]